MTDGQNEGRAAARATLIARVTIVAALVVGTVVVSLQLMTTVQTNGIAKGIKNDQAASAARGKDIARAADQIESCTTPGEDCFKRSQKATASAVGSINQVAVYASACAADADPALPVRKRVKVIERCVRVLLESSPAVP